MVRELLSWWLRQLRGLLPAGWRRPTGVAADGALLLELASRRGDTPAVTARLRRRGGWGSLGHYPLDAAGAAALRAAVGSRRRGPVVLLLPPPLWLEQAVSLPLAAERGLDTALRWEMDRLTPFAAEAVFWSWSVRERDRSRGKLDLDLRLVPKATVEPALAALAAAGLAPSLLAAAAAPTRTVPLGPRGRFRPRLLATGAVALAGLLLTAAAFPFLQQQRRADALAARIEALRPQVDAAEALRRQLRERDARVDVFAAERARVGDALGALATLTALLPDDTFLYEFGLRDRQLTLSGQSGAAARLIPILAADPAIQDPVFSAPVTRNEMSGRQTFSIRAELRP